MYVRTYVLYVLGLYRKTDLLNVGTGPNVIAFTSHVRTYTYICTYVRMYIYTYVHEVAVKVL